MSRWVVPNWGPVVLVLGNDVDISTDKRNLLQALDAAAKAGELRGDLAIFKDLLASHIELERELTAENPKVAYG